MLGWWLISVVLGGAAIAYPVLSRILDDRPHDEQWRRR